MDFSPATVAALVEAIRLRCDDQTFSVAPYPQLPLFQPTAYDRTLPGSEALRPRSVASGVCYVARALYRLNPFGVYMLADSSFALIAQGLIAQEMTRQLDEFDRRYPPTKSLYSPQSY